MSERLAPAEFESETDAQIAFAGFRSAGLVQSPWFGFGVAAVFVVIALAFGAERVWLFGVAGIAVLLGIIDWAGGSDSD